MGDHQPDDPLARGNRTLVYVLAAVAAAGVLACAGAATLVALLYRLATPIDQ
jgi:hypothetical protein